MHPNKLWVALPAVGMLAWLSSWAGERPGSSEWIDLFNGRDLSGWSVRSIQKDKDKAYWRVVDGAIECDSRGRPDHDYVWLVSDGEYGDFELRVLFQAFAESPGNSGIQVRSRYDDDPAAPRGGWLDGPQIDIHPPSPWRTGLIYDETRGEQRWVYPSLENWEIEREQGPASWRFYYVEETDSWNELSILCLGTTIRTNLNGFQVADFEGSGILNNEFHRARRVGMKGHIALQLHTGDELRIRFKRIQLRTLDSPK